jgi:hypothetical protein
MAVEPSGHWPLFSFLILYTVGSTPWTGDQPVARPLPTHRTTKTQNKRTQTSVPRVGFEPTIPVLERKKTVHAIVMGLKHIAIPVTGSGGPQGCETSRLPYFLDNRLTDGGEVVSLTRWPAGLCKQIDLHNFLANL